jgi:hypothetical protein
VPCRKPLFAQERFHLKMNNEEEANEIERKNF